MTNYVPSTAEIKGAYVFDEGGDTIESAEAKREFDRWLEAVKAEVWEVAFKEARRKGEFGYYELPETWNPYRKDAR